VGAREVARLWLRGVLFVFAALSVGSLFGVASFCMASSEACGSSSGESAVGAWISVVAGVAAVIALLVAAGKAFGRGFREMRHRPG
jgi:hypothetical protein